MRIGLALSGGGARGIAHIGVIKALEELGLTVSCLSGASAGSIVAALYSYGYEPTKILEIIQTTKMTRSFRPAWTWAGLLAMDGLRDLLLKYLPENSFQKLKIPLTVAATEIQLAETHYFSEGELITPILASCTVPAVFRPTPLNGGLYIDGGILDNLPVKPLIPQCDLLIGSNCNHLSREFDPKNVKVVIERTILIAIKGSTQKSRDLCDVFIEPTGLGRYSGYEIAKAKEIFDFAYQFTRENFTEKDFEKAGE